MYVEEIETIVAVVCPVYYTYTPTPKTAHRIAYLKFINQFYIPF